MSLQGEIQTMPLQDLLQWLELVHKTGTLTVENKEARQQFYFRNGEITTASSSSYHSTDSEQSVKVIIVDTLQWETGKFGFAFNTTQRDYVVLKAIEKPMINLLWIGTLILMIGFIMAIIRRYREFKLMRDKGL